MHSMARWPAKPTLFNKHIDLYRHDNRVISSPRLGATNDGADKSAWTNNNQGVPKREPRFMENNNNQSCDITRITIPTANYANVQARSMHLLASTSDWTTRCSSQQSSPWRSQYLQQLRFKQQWKSFRESLFVHSDELRAAADAKHDNIENDANSDNQHPDDDNDNNERPNEQQSKAEDLIFEMFQDGNGRIRMADFLNSLTMTGLIPETDLRLKEFMGNLKSLSSTLTGHSNNVSSLFLDKAQFKKAIQPNIVLINKAMRGDFVIPDWQRFSSTLEEFYWRCRVNKNGRVANYIPQLAKYNPDYFGVSVCSIDGQRYHVGDIDVPFTIQSSGKPINYAIALNELGTDVTHQYVGQEPSGRLFNDLSLKIFDEGGRPRPHNPMVNSGAIIVCSLLMNLIKSDMRSSEKFDWVCDFYKSMAGGEYIGFNNATFLSEREAADRNYAIAFYMRENKCFPESANLQQVMDFYFQLCSLEVNAQTVAMIAATLANGGICPITEKKVIDSRAVRNVLSLMHSCGMYDYSGQFAFYVGLPAKSGVSGCTLVVIPNVVGMGLFSPPLDAYGNSVRGLQFCHELINKFNFHQYDNLRHVPYKSDPRRKKYETRAVNIISLLFAAAKGDMSAIRRYYMSGMDMASADYDHRTALHTAAAEGHLDIIEFLLHVAQINHEPRDRWGRRPIDDALFAEHKHVADFLERWPDIKANLDKEKANNKSTS